MAKDDIVLSEKFGLNPSINKCFWCGGTKNIAIMGKMVDKKTHEEIEAPREIILDYEPCDECQEKWDSGVTFIECSLEPLHPNQPPLTTDDSEVGAYPTGRYIVIGEEAYHRCFESTGIYQYDTKKGDIKLMDCDLFRLVFEEEMQKEEVC